MNKRYNIMSGNILRGFVGRGSPIPTVGSTYCVGAIIGELLNGVVISSSHDLGFCVEITNETKMKLVDGYCLLGSTQLMTAKV